MSVLEDKVAALLNKCGDEELMDFKVKFLGMPEEIAKHPFFASSNLSRWGFVVDQYGDYIRAAIGRSGAHKEGQSEGPPPAYSDLDSSRSSSSSTSSQPWRMPSLNYDYSIPLPKRKYNPDAAEAPKNTKRIRMRPLDEFDTTSSDDEVAAAYIVPKPTVKKKQVARPSPPLREHIDETGRVFIDLTSP